MFVSANQVFQTTFFKGKIVSLFWKKESCLFLKKEREKVFVEESHVSIAIPQLQMSLYFPQETY